MKAEQLKVSFSLVLHENVSGKTAKYITAIIVYFKMVADYSK